MDINLPDMMGNEATKLMRQYEKEFDNVHTNIVAVTVEGLSGKLDSNVFRIKGSGVV